MKLKTTILSLILLIVIFTFSCGEETVNSKYLTENVIVVIMDGARYSETSGDSTYQKIPRIAQYISKVGIVNTEFYNQGPTAYPKVCDSQTLSKKYNNISPPSSLTFMKMK